MKSVPYRDYFALEVRSYAAVPEHRPKVRPAAVVVLSAGADVPLNRNTAAPRHRWRKRAIGLDSGEDTVTLNPQIVRWLAWLEVVAPRTASISESL